MAVPELYVELGLMYTETKKAGEDEVAVVPVEQKISSWKTNSLPSLSMQKNTFL